MAEKNPHETLCVSNGDQEQSRPKRFAAQKAQEQTSVPFYKEQNDIKKAVRASLIESRRQAKVQERCQNISDRKIIESNGISVEPDTPTKQRLKAQRKYAYNAFNGISCIRKAKEEKKRRKKLKKFMSEIFPKRRPNVEDLLTYLCFHDMNCLPLHLDLKKLNGSSTMSEDSSDTDCYDSKVKSNSSSNDDSSEAESTDISYGSGRMATRSCNQLSIDANGDSTSRIIDSQKSASAGTILSVENADLYVKDNPSNSTSKIERVEINEGVITRSQQIRQLRKCNDSSTTVSHDETAIQGMINCDKKYPDHSEVAIAGHTRLGNRKTYKKTKREYSPKSGSLPLCSTKSVSLSTSQSKSPKKIRNTRNSTSKVELSSTKIYSTSSTVTNGKSRPSTPIGIRLAKRKARPGHLLDCHYFLESDDSDKERCMTFIAQRESTNYCYESTKSEDDKSSKKISHRSKPITLKYSTNRLTSSPVSSKRSACFPPSGGINSGSDRLSCEMNFQADICSSRSLKGEKSTRGLSFPKGKETRDHQARNNTNEVKTCLLESLTRNESQIEDKNTKIETRKSSRNSTFQVSPLRSPEISNSSQCMKSEKRSLRKNDDDSKNNLMNIDCEEHVKKQMLMIERRHRSLRLPAAAEVLSGDESSSDSTSSQSSSSKSSRSSVNIHRLTRSLELIKQMQIKAKKERKREERVMKHKARHELKFTSNARANPRKKLVSIPSVRKRRR